MASPDLVSTRASLWPRRLAQAVVAIFLAAKLYLTFSVPPIGDEAYYWMWGQKLGWSYFDHPPLHAWLLHLMGLIFGWNLFSLRVLTWLTLAGCLSIFWQWAKRARPESPQDWFWPAAAFYLASPLFFLMSSIAFHDHLLIFLCLLSSHLFLVFAERWEASGRGFAWLYAAAVALGLAVLTKYNGLLVGFGVALFFIVRRPLRPLWRSPHLYLAALLAVALQAPVLWWNLTEGLASYKFHLSDRWGGSFHLQIQTLPEFIILAILVVSPFLFPGLIRLIRRPLGNPFVDRARHLAISVFVVSTAAMAFLSLFVETAFYWNITAYLLLIPLLPGWMPAKKLAILHYIFGLIAVSGLIYNHTVYPLEKLANRRSYWTTASMYGWPEVAARIAEERFKRPIGFVAATRYTTAAQLGWAMHDPEVVALSPRQDQYDYWFDPAAHEGQDALVVSDRQLGLANVRGHFDKLTRLATLPVQQLGTTIFEPTIYLGQGFHAAEPSKSSAESKN